MKAIICFSPTTFMAVPKASAEVSRTVGSVKLGAIIRLSFLLQSPDYTVISKCPNFRKCEQEEQIDIQLSCVSFQFLKV
jgi:hypothetical protein